MKVYLVESAGGTRRIYAIFKSKEDAKMHQGSINKDDTIIVERTCFTGQANNPGFNR